MATTWIEDIRTWSARQPENDGLTLLFETLNETSGNVGNNEMSMGMESMRGCIWQTLTD